MRIARLLPCVLALAACGGGNKNTPPDGPPPPDGKDIDAGIDAPDLDAPVDAPPGAASRVWAVGDFLTDGRRQAGAFASDATLPFNTATPPPIVVPNGAADSLFSLAGSTANVFDARGAKIAYVADQTVAGRFDLYVANADGSSPVLVVTGQTGVSISSVALSPDGTKVGFLMDSLAISTGFDLYVVTTDGTGTPVQLSPARPATDVAQDVFFQFEWSKDSKLIAFSADLTENGFDQAYVVDTTAATPAAVELLARADIATQAAGAQGVRGKLLFDNANNIYFRARVSTDNNSQFTFFKADPTGAKVTLATPARGDASVSDIGAFGITPDGATLVFSADAPTARVFNLFTQAVVNPQTPANLTNLTTALAGTATIRAEFTTPLFFSPDSKHIAVAANFNSTDAALTRMEPFVVETDGSGLHRTFAVPSACGACDVEQLAWTADGTKLFVTGDVATNNDQRLFALDPTMTDQTITSAVEVPTGGDVINLFVVAP